MSTLPTWVTWLQALSVPAIAFAGLLVAISNFRLARLRRKDELLDRRFAFYREVVASLASSQKEYGRQGKWDGYTQERYAIEARFLFGDDISAHIETFQTPLDEKWIGPGHVSPELVRPFDKYLSVRP